MQNKHTRETALKSLLRKNGVSLEKGIVLKIKCGSLGNGSLGKLSYLKKQHGFIVNWY